MTLGPSKKGCILKPKVIPKTEHGHNFQSPNFMLLNTLYVTETEK